MFRLVLRSEWVKLRHTRYVQIVSFSKTLLSTDFMNINTETVKILLTIGLYLADVLDLYRYLRKRPAPKFGPLNPRYAKSEPHKSRVSGTKMYGGMEAHP